MTQRTKIERVGGHLLIGESVIPIAQLRASSCTKADVRCYVWSDNDAMDDAPVVAHGWTAREILEVVYGSAPDEVSDLNATIDDLTRAGLEMERAKNEEIAVLREALRRFIAKGDVDYCTRQAAMSLIGVEPWDINAKEAGLASIRESAKVGR